MSPRKPDDRLEAIVHPLVKRAGTALCAMPRIAVDPAAVRRSLPDASNLVSAPKSPGVPADPPGLT